MRLYKYAIAAALLWAAIMPATTTAKSVVAEKVYMFGFAASFNDTIVHFTDIQLMDSVWTDSRTKFILGRGHYSNELRDYLASKNMPHRTCIVFSDKKLGRLEKRYLKMRKLYEGNKKQKNRNDIRTIPYSDFQFKSLDKNWFVGEEETVVKKTKKEKKDKAKKDKKKKTEKTGGE